MWIAWLLLFCTCAGLAIIVWQTWALQEEVKERREHPYRYNKRTGRRW